MNPYDQISVPVDKPTTSIDHGQVETTDFRITGNLRSAYAYLQDMYGKKPESKSGPIKPMTQLELDREKHKSEGKFLKELPTSNF